MAHDVFISYSTKNTEYAEAVCEKLEDNGIECWIAPRNIVYGQDVIVLIHDGVRPISDSETIKKNIEYNQKKLLKIIRP